MRSIRFRVLVAAVAVLLGTALAKSQTSETAPPSAPMHGPWMMGEHMLNHFAKVLNMTDDQQAQAKSVLQKEEPTLKALFQQQHQIDAQLHQNAEGTYDAKQVQTLAQQKAQIQQQMTIEETQLHHQLYQLLTPEQQTQLKQIEADRQARMQQHMEDGPAPPPAD
jgi:periplasmic protein CpxP/Spy